MEISEAAAVARPIGNKVFGNIFDARYAPGILIRIIEHELCRNEISDLPQATEIAAETKMNSCKYAVPYITPHILTA